LVTLVFGRSRISDLSISPPCLYEIGGYTAERKVYLDTGKVKINALDKTKHHVKPVIIHTNGKN
jgi:hypothetical protein